MKKGIKRILGRLVAAILLACTLTPAQQQRPLALAPADRGEADRFRPTERNPRYRICRDDILLLSFPLSPELNQKVTVQPDGFISLQSAGSIHVEGLTVPEVIEAVKKVYSGTLHEPIVDIDLADFQKPFFTVMGQVGKPGQYDLRYDTTVVQALAVAGGLASTATNQVFLYRAVSPDWAEVRELKLKDILSGKNIKEDVHLRPGDMIVVPENKITKFRKYVPYSLALTPPVPSTF
jgi:protein involved in polysaccharide export with SLBB domain